MSAHLRIVIVVCCTVLVTGCRTGKAHVSVFTPDEQIRERLLAHTPIGSSGTNVLRSVLDGLCPHKQVSAYSGYVDALQAGESSRLPVARTHWMTEPHRTIDVELGSYPAGLMFMRIVTVRWIFDEQDSLTDLSVRRGTIGP
jgi:hypothetical protein